MQLLIFSTVDRRRLQQSIITRTFVGTQIKIQLHIDTVTLLNIREESRWQELVNKEIKHSSSEARFFVSRVSKDFSKNVHRILENGSFMSNDFGRLLCAQ
jgi:hypothetical protein